MIRQFSICLLTFIPLAASFGQNERKLVREGVKEYQNNKYSEAEVKFRKALDAKPDLYEAEYNIANSLYKQKKYEEAAKEYENLLKKTNDPERKADAYHNIGNSQIMSQQFEKGIEAYKNSLRIRPKDEDTRYNLAYALQKLQEQQQQKEQNKDKKDQDQKDKDQKNKEDQKDQQDKENKENKDQENKNKEDKNKQQDQNPDQKKQQESAAEKKLNEKEAEQMLNAVQNQEKDVKEKVDRKKAVARPARTDKDW